MVGGEGVEVQPACAEAVRSLTLEDDVTRRHEFPESTAVSGVIEIEGHAELAGVVVPPPQAPFGTRDIVQEGGEATRRVASVRLHQDHLRAEVGQDLPGERALLARQFDHADAREGSHSDAGHNTPSSASLASSCSVCPSRSPKTSMLCSPRHGAPRSTCQSVFEK